MPVTVRSERKECPTRLERSRIKSTNSPVFERSRTRGRYLTLLIAGNREAPGFVKMVNVGEENGCENSQAYTRYRFAVTLLLESEVKGYAMFSSEDRSYPLIP